MSGRIALPRLTDHGSEIALLGVIALGTIGILALIVRQGGDGWDVAAFLLVLQRIIEAVTARWTQRSVDRMGQQLGASAPTPDPIKQTVVEGEAA